MHKPSCLHQGASKPADVLGGGTDPLQTLLKRGLLSAAHQQTQAYGPNALAGSSYPPPSIHPPVPIGRSRPVGSGCCRQLSTGGDRHLVSCGATAHPLGEAATLGVVAWLELGAGVC